MKITRPLCKMSSITNISFVLKSTILYGVMAFAFSIIGLFLPDRFIVGNPLEVSGVSIEHILGHVGFGLVVGIVTFSIRYMAVAGLFPLALDADHLIQFLDIEMIPRMAHSVVFGLISAVVFFVVFGKRDLRLAAIAFSAVLAHMAFDVFLSGTTGFPVFAPFSSDMVVFDGIQWIILEILAGIIVGIACMQKWLERFNTKQRPAA